MGGFTSNSAQWLSQEEARLDRTAQNMTQVMVNRGRILAPVLSGKLANSGRVVRKLKASYSATFGGLDVGVPYALRRNFENKKNPQTLHYSEKSGDSVAKENIKKYYDMSK